MKRLSKIFTIIVFSFCFLVFNFNFVFAGFSDYSDQIKTTGYSEAENKCTSECPSDGTKYYQLTTGVPFLGANATKCACVPVSSGIQFFLTSILKFVLGSVATITTIIIIVAGFRWAFSAGNKKTISDSKNMIRNAIVGLIMSLTSGLMLKVINPKLLSMEVLKVDSVNIAQAVDLCGDVKSDFAKRRNSQLCRLSSSNSFTAGGVNFALSWSICDVSGENCGKAQELSQDNIAKYNQSNGMVANCANMNDNFGRFSIKINSISNISSDLIFDCATDGGVDSMKVKNTVGYYGMCRVDNDYCIDNKNSYCVANNNSDDNCKGTQIYMAKSHIKSSVDVLTHSSGPNKIEKDLFVFDCYSEDSNYLPSDFEICNANDVCTKGVATTEKGRPGISAIDILGDPDMKFGIKFNTIKDKDLKLICSSVNGKNTKTLTVSGGLIKKLDVGAILELCLGGWGKCGLSPYNQIQLNFLNYGIFDSDGQQYGQFNCNDLTNKTSCETYKIGTYNPCHWDDATIIGYKCNKNY